MCQRNVQREAYTPADWRCDILIEPEAFNRVFAALREILELYAGRADVMCDERSGVYQLSSTTKTDRTGRPLFIASVQVNKNYVSYHLMPLYMNPTLLAAVSPILKKRMQGKSCFNFTSIDRDQLAELAKLTKQGIASFQDVKLPWDQAKNVSRSKPAGASRTR